jgi:SanA protein
MKQKNFSIKKRMQSFKYAFKILKWLFVSGVLMSVIMIIFMNCRIKKKKKNFVFENVEIIPENKVGLLLGTSKLLKSGHPNQYFYNRITAAVELFEAGKIKIIVISGDNSKKHYNEPQDMKEELVKRGIPKNKIYLDYAGFRTYDSMYRMKEIFGQNSFTIISQKFHNQRAIYIANSLGLNTVGYNAKDVDAYNGFKTKLREKFARVKVFIDLMFNKKPKFLGEKIIIE